MQKKYKATEIIDRAKITKMQLNHWINMGVIRPYVDDARRGGVRYFSEENLFETLVSKYLNDRGLPVQAILGIVKAIRDPAPHRKEKSFFATFKDNPKLGNFFLIAAQLTYYDKNGTKKDFLSNNQNLPKNAKKEIYKKSLAIEICPADKLSENLLKYPVAILVNLTSIANEAINM